MAGWPVSRIGAKLFIVITIIIFAAIVPFSYVAVYSVEQFGSFASQVNEQEIRSQSYAFLTNLTSEISGKYETAFTKISTASSLLARQAALIYDHLALFGRHPIQPQEFARLQTNGIFYNAFTEGVATLYWGGHDLSEAIMTEIQALSWLDPLFEKTKKEIPESLAVHNITASGIGRYLTTNPVAQKALNSLPPPSEFDLRDGEPVTMHFKEAAQRRKKLWTDVYRDDVIDGLMMTSSSPIFDKNGKFCGIAGIDVPLDYLIDELLHIQLGAGGEANDVLFAFLLDKDGRIIAFPEQYYDLFGLQIDISAYKDSSDIFAYKLSDSSLNPVRKAAEEIIQGTDGIRELTLHGARYILSSSELPTLGWHLGLVIQEAELFASISATRKAMDATVDKMVTKFIVYAIGLMTVSLLLVFLGIRVFVVPLRKLTASVEKVSKGDLDIQLPVERNDELGILAGSFNAMTESLRKSAAQKKVHTLELEQKIKDRTEDLEKKNRELHAILSELKVEITQRVKTEEDMQKYKLIVSSTSDFISLIDKNYRYLIVNDAYLKNHGKQREEIVGHTIPQLHGEDKFSRDIKPMFDDCLEGRVKEYQSWFDYPNTGRRYMNINYSPYLVDSRVEGVIVSARDVTEMKMAQEELTEAHNTLEARVQERTKELAEANLSLQREMKERARVEEESRDRELKAITQGKLASLGEIATGIAHEINQPLTFIQIIYQAILRDIQSENLNLDELQEDCQEALQQVGRIIRIIDHLRTFGREDSLEIEDIQLHEVVQNALILLAQQLKNSNIDLAVEIDDDLPAVRGCGAKMEQVFINLFQNSIDALKGKKGAEIGIVGTVDKDTIQIRFTDNGDGVPVENQARVFEPFFTTKPVGKGTGLGLSIVYGIINEHNGHIECVPLESGVCFLITLPVAEQV